MVGASVPWGSVLAGFSRSLAMSQSPYLYVLSRTPGETLGALKTRIPQRRLARAEGFGRCPFQMHPIHNFVTRYIGLH
jgi:hypothetical protein